MDDRYSRMPYWFGPESWCVITDEGTKVDAPLGLSCLYCDEAVDEDDSGYMRPVVAVAERAIVPVHRECDFRMVMGGVECMKRQRDGTHVVGDHTPDPPDLSKREAACAAWEFYDEHRDHWIAWRQ